MAKITLLAAAALSAGFVAACTGHPPPGAAAPHASTPPARATPGVVAWVDHRAAPVPAVLRTAPYSTGARPCQPDGLRVSHGQVGYATGHTAVQVYLTNRSAAACWLDGYPSVAGVAANGAVTPLPVTDGSFFGNPGPSANIKPGQTAAVNISGGDLCALASQGEHQVYPELLVGLPAGGTVGVYGTGFDTICGVSVSMFGVPADRSQAPAPSPLTASITAGATARAGTDLGYLVTLANPTARPFALRPCPSYAEFLGGLTGPGAAKSHVVRYYYLNCAAARSIPAHGSVTFQIELPLPPAFPAGHYSKLDWQVQGGTGPAALASVTVEPRA